MRLRSPLSWITVSLVMAGHAHAASGTWNVDANGNWSTAGNWAADIADGSGFTASFTNDITADRVVTLDGARTLTNLIFGDGNTATAGSWTLSGANVLTLAGTTPTITVNALGTGKTATISSVMTGSAGMTKAGVGTLVLSALNTYGGGTIVNEGSLTLTAAGTFGTSNSTIGSGALTINTGASVTTTGGAFRIEGQNGGSNTRTVNLNGGTLTLAGSEYFRTINLTGGTLNGPTATNEFLRVSSAGMAINSLASATTSTINNKLDLSYANLAVDVENGAAASDLAITGAITETGSRSITKTGAGNLTLSGNNSFSGGLIVNGGTVTLTSPILTAGFSNGGAGTGAITINSGAVLTTSGGAFKIDRNTGTGNSRVININGGTLNLAAAEYIKTVNLTGGTLNAPVSGDYFRASSAGIFFNSLASSSSSTITGLVDLTYAGLTVDVADGAAANDLVISGTISQNTGGGSGAKTLTKTGAGTLVISGSAANTYNGLTTVSGGQFTIDKNDGVQALGGNLSVSGGAKVVLTGAKSNRIADAATVTLDGSGTSFDVQGNISENVATLTMTNGVTLNLNSNASSSAVNFRSTGITISGGGTINVGVTGTTGTTSLVFLSTGGFTATGDVAINSANPTVSNVDLNGASRTFAINSGTTTIAPRVIGNASAALVKTGAGTLVLSNASTYTGGTTVSEGTLRLGHATDTLANTGAVTVNGATAVLSITGNNDTVGAVSLRNGGTISGTGGTLTGTSYAVESGTISARLGGTGALVKSTSGTVTMTGINTYTGTTTVNDGTLVMNGSATGSAFTVNDGGTLEGSGSTGALTVADGGTVGPGNSPGILSTGNFSLQSGGSLEIELDGNTVGTGYDQLNVTGTVSLSGLLSLTSTYTPSYGEMFFILANDGFDAITGTFTGLEDGSLFSNEGRDYRITYFANYDAVTPSNSSFTGGNDVALMAVPEPSAALMASLGALALCRRRRTV